MREKAFSGGLLGLLFFAFSVSAGWAQTTGTIRGTVTDPSGAVVPGANVTATLSDTYVSRSLTTNESGDYEFPALPVGRYTVAVQALGFKIARRNEIEVRLGHVSTVDVRLELGPVAQVVNAEAAAPLIEIVSTQIGAVVNDKAVVELPLNTRDTYQLLQLQPGVQSQLGSDLFYGSDQPGVVSVNGGRGRSNNYTVNGGDANDQFVNLPGVEPSPDTIEEFRVLTNTFDAEFGRNSGAVVNVVTKSGSNALHGDLYEFFRNNVLNARGFFDTAIPDFKQNQFGGTLGGPVRKDQTFFFSSYEGRRIRQGTPSPAFPVPTAAERNGDFSAGGSFWGTLNDSTVSDLLNSRPGCGTAVAEAGGAPIAPGTLYSAIFPNSHIPTQCFDPTAVDLMNQYVPAANLNGTEYQSVPTSREYDDQLTGRIDHKLSDHQQFNAYYYFTDQFYTQPFSYFQGAGANVPGFGGLYNNRYQQVNLTHTWVISSTTVNELRFAAFREAQGEFNHPQHTNLVQDSCATVPADQCFSDPKDPALGITPHLGAGHEGVPFVSVSGGFVLGNNYEGELPQIGNTFQWMDNLSKIVGNHSLKFGADARRQRFDQLLYFNVNGDYSFLGGGSNDPEFGFQDSQGNFTRTDLYPNYLLGLPDSYLQGSAQNEAVRSSSLYLYAQDSWKIRPALTLNYGLRWELNTPIADVGGRTQTFRPGQSTTVFPCQLSANNPLVGTFGTTACGPYSAGESVFPLGLVVPGDKGISDALTQTYYKAFAPRIGLAWSPSWNNGTLGKITGGPGKTSLRAGWGMFYNPMEQLVLEQFSGEPPFGGSVNLSETLFNTPFLGQNGSAYPNPFNGILNPRRGQPVDWSSFRPILMFGELQPNIRAQYAAQYNFNVQRELTGDMVLQVGYVGSQGHRLLATHDLNYGNAQTCLDLANISNFYANSNPALSATFACGPFYSDSAFQIPANSIPAGMSVHLPYGSVPVVSGPNNPAITLVGLRRYSSPFCEPTTGNGCPPDGTPVFASIFAQDTIANSAYNSLQLSLERRFAKGLQFLAAYTWSKSYDDASSFENTLDPLCFRCSRALSLFNAPQRFVLSYYWELPVPEKRGLVGKVVDGWGMSGIFSFQSGFPIRITSWSDLELENSQDFEYPGEPDLVGKFTTQDPRKSGCALGTGPTAGAGAPPCQTVANQFFDPNAFAPQALGTIGDSPRSLCCGPGINNADLALLKTTRLAEHKELEFRAEFFNAFNHAQFYVPDGNITDGPTFGQVSKARDPRLIQFALKLLF
ncbi:MAG TPA: carboxypeptidase regulatory-like domain-containing protein [Terriglobia bacterium]|nr:carboxypeptidase regulatory-like domain-containing protein [Terriglobia bacterium]